MELLLALGGLAALAALLQSKALPTEDDFKKAVDKLEKNPKDPDASTIAGKYTAFVLGDYAAGLPFLSNSSDEMLRNLAAHELDPEYTDSAPKKVGMGDEWVLAARKNPALFRIFYDRASQWYVLAWPDLDGPWKDKARAQGRKLAVARPPGAAKKQVPAGWISDVSVSGRPPFLDGTVSRSGSYSIRMVPADEKIPGSISVLKSDLFPITGKTVEVSAYVFADGTDNKDDRLFLWYLGPKGNIIGSGLIGNITLDTPFWNRVIIKSNVPDSATKALIGVGLYSKIGALWVDDVSVRFDGGKNILKNPSFDA